MAVLSWKDTNCSFLWNFENEHCPNNHLFCCWSRSTLFQTPYCLFAFKKSTKLKPKQCFHSSFPKYWQCFWMFDAFDVLISIYWSLNLLIIQNPQEKQPFYLTEEERRTLVAEGLPVPTGLPLTKVMNVLYKREVLKCCIGFEWNNSCLTNVGCQWNCERQECF